MSGQTRESVSQIQSNLNKLDDDFELKQLSRQERHEALERLRDYTTKTNNLGPLATKQAVYVCCRYGFDYIEDPSASTALRCLCNIMLLAEPTRQMFVDEEYSRRALERMKNFDDSFIPARLLFFCTYGTNLDFNIFFCDHDLAEIIDANISYYAELIKDRASEVEVTATHACNEHLKLLHSLTAKYPLHIWRFRRVLRPILEIFSETPVTQRPLETPISLLINAMVNLDFQQGEEQTPSPLFTACLDKLGHVLDLASRSYTSEDLDELGSPLVQLFLRISETVSTGQKSHLCAIFLPSEKDRENVLGKGDSLPSRLLSLFNQVTAPRLKVLLPALYFVLSDNDTDSFVENVGYGLAAGFLRLNGMQGPDAWPKGSAQKTNIAGSHENLYRSNYVTGQSLDKEAQVSNLVMTDDEKEREAERLFVLFERMRSTGVMKIENPVAVAQREGRFEELN